MLVALLIGLIPPLFCFFFLILAVSLAQATRCWRRAVLLAATLWGALAVLFTEGLSLFHALTTGGVLLCWVLAFLGAGGACLWHSRSYRLHLSLERLRKVDALFWGGLVLLGSIAALLGIIALAAAPNTWDSMTFHLARVVHWQQNQSVESYPTNDLRQLYEQPGAEFIILQFRLLTGGDQAANLVQWFSMLGSLLGVSLIAKQLGAALRGQVIAALFAATLPMGILQATSTQTDYAEAFWLVCLVSFLLSFKAAPTWLNAAISGAALGLTLLTKGTGYLFAVPILLWIGIWALSRLRWRVWRPALFLLAPALLLNLGYFARNLATFGHLLGPPSETDLYPNTTFTPAALLSGVVRNLALQIGTPNPSFNTRLEHGITQFLGFWGINPSDPRTTWPGTSFHLNPLSYHEDYAGNPLHLGLFLIVVVLCLTLKRLRQRDLLLYLAAVVGAFLLFCLYLKWQPWNSRLQLPLFVLAAPVVGVALSRLHVSLGVVLPLTLVVCAWPWLVGNHSRPLLGAQSVLITPRIDQYFANQRGLEPLYLHAAQVTQQRGCSQIGLAMNNEDWEYPLWVLLDPTGDSALRIEQVNISPTTAALLAEPAFRDFHPCALITLDASQTRALQANKEYTEAWQKGGIGVFFPVHDGGDRFTYAQVSKTIYTTAFLLVRGVLLVDCPWRMRLQANSVSRPSANTDSLAGITRKAQPSSGFTCCAGTGIRPYPRRTRRL